MGTEKRMDSGLCQKRINVNGDRLSALPDDLIHKIFSSFDIKHVIETSVLSSRWRYIWTSMPFLNFSSDAFDSLLKFSKFVNHVLCLRNNQIDVFSVKLGFSGKATQVFVKRILNYAFCHNVQHMTIKYLLQKRRIELPLSLFTFHSLKHLTFSGASYDHPITLTSSTWDLPAVTTLHLSYIIFDDVITDESAGRFSKYTNLKNLTLNHCKILGSDGFTICHPQLCSLKFMNEYRDLNTVNVVAPQLRNLSLLLNAYDSLQFISDSLPSLEKVDLHIGSLYMTERHKIINLFQQFCCVKFLTLNTEIVQALTSAPELISNQPSPFPNLKSLKIFPFNVHSTNAALEANVSKIVKNYLVDSSAGPTVTIVSHEVMRAITNAESAQKLMKELRVLLNQENAISNMVPVGHWKTPKQSHKGKKREQGKAQVENQGEQRAIELPLHIRGKLSKIQSCWYNLSQMFSLEKRKVYRLSSDLREIERLLKEVPASKKDALHACFSSLCAEADIAISKYIDRMKIHCDTKISSLSV